MAEQLPFVFMTEKKSSNKKTIWGNLIIALVSLFVGLIIVEAGLAIFLPFPDYIIKPEPYVEDSELAHRFKSNGELYQNGEVFYTDPNGFRVLARDDYPQDDDQVVLFIGDSQTFGWMVTTEETFVYKTETRLHELGYDIRTVNASSPGWNLWHYQSVYDELTELYPDISAIVLYLVDNDWQPPDNHDVENGYLVDKYKEDAARFIPKSVRVFLSRFHFWRYFTLAWREIRDRRNAEEAAEVVVESYASKWVEETEPLTYILAKAEESRIPIIIVTDEEVAEVEAIMAVLNQADILALISIGNVGGGYMYDGHIGIDKHDALATELVKLLNELGTLP